MLGNSKGAIPMTRGESIQHAIGDFWDGTKGPLRSLITAVGIVVLFIWPLLIALHLYPNSKAVPPWEYLLAWGVVVAVWVIEAFTVYVFNRSRELYRSANNAGN